MGVTAGEQDGPTRRTGGDGQGIDLATAAGLARSLADLMRASHQVVMSEVSPVAARVGAHLECELGAIASVSETFPLGKTPTCSAASTPTWRHGRVRPSGSASG